MIMKSMRTLLLSGKRELSPVDSIVKKRLIVPIFQSGLTNCIKKRMSRYLNLVSEGEGFCRISFA
jgi:hypothetical protein